MGALLCLLSAAGFGAMGIFGKLAYEDGVGVGDLLLVRFALASLLLLAVAGARGALRGLSRRGLLAGLGTGASGRRRGGSPRSWSRWPGSCSCSAAPRRAAWMRSARRWGSARR